MDLARTAKDTIPDSLLSTHTLCSDLAWIGPSQKNHHIHMVSVKECLQTLGVCNGAKQTNLLSFEENQHLESEGGFPGGFSKCFFVIQIFWSPN